MTRLTEAKWREALATTKSLADFVDAVAALAVQEVERERDRASTMSDQYRAKWADADSRNTALRAQLAAVKEERDISRSLYREMYEHYQRELATLRAQLATAKREAFVAGSEWYHSPKMDVHAEARSRYPATPSGEGVVSGTYKPTHESATIIATPSPEAREPFVIPLTREIDNFTGITITPADAKRIGILGGWRDA